MAVIYFLVGISGSGKSTWAKCWARAKNAIVVSSDAIRAELFGDESIQGNAALVFDTAHRHCIEALANGKNVIFDATNVTSWSREALLKKLPAGTKKVAVVFHVHPETAIRRQEKRERKVPVNIIYSQWDNLIRDMHDISVQFDQILDM